MIINNMTKYDIYPISILLIVALFAIGLLEHLDSFGVEVTTIKGKWQSEKFENDGYYSLQISDNGYFDFYAMATDTTYSKYIHGTWLNNKDTISLYSQGKSKEVLIIEGLSMNTMTIKTGKNYLIMTRQYNDPNAKFLEVLKLKKGLWYYVYIIIRGVMYYIIWCAILLLACGLVGLILKLLKKIIWNR